MSAQSLCAVTVFGPDLWDNESEAASGANPTRPLTRSSVLTREKAPMKTTRPCSIDGCERAYYANGMCAAHCQKLRTGRTCSVEGCDREGQMRRGMCGLHYRRLRQWDNTEPPAQPTVEDRFWTKVNKSGPIPEYNPSLGNCWDWTVSCNESRGGYGQFNLDNQTVRAPRLAWEIVNGPIPDGLVLDHLCRRPVCVNPSHLEPVTDAENLRRAAVSRRLERAS